MCVSVTLGAPIWRAESAGHAVALIILRKAHSLLLALHPRILPGIIDLSTLQEEFLRGPHVDILPVFREPALLAVCSCG